MTKLPLCDGESPIVFAVCRGCIIVESICDSPKDEVIKHPQSLE